MPPSTQTLPPPTSAALALQQSRFASWFPRYRRYSPKASVIDLLAVQPDFLQWLEEDGLVLPLDSDDRPVVSRANEELDNGTIDDVWHDDGQEDEAEEAQARDFSELNQRIRQIIDKYEGAVFPKLDWSAPLDAAWMVPGSTLRCTEPSDVYLLLKSSDFVNQDVSQLHELQHMDYGRDNADQFASNAPATDPVRPHLVLKKFFSMPTSHEFRCFVRAGRLVCVSQRDIGTFFEHLQPRHVQRTIQRKLLHFFKTVLQPKQAYSSSSSQAETSAAVNSCEPFPLQDFVWDAYLTRDLSRVLIVDVNPYLERTDALLWQWSEVEAEALHALQLSLGEGCGQGQETSEEVDDSKRDDDSDEFGAEEYLPRLRLVASRAQTTQSFPTYAHNMMPTDVVGLSQGTDIANFARQFNEQLAQAALPLTNEIGDDGIAVTNADDSANESGPGR